MYAGLAYSARHVFVRRRSAATGQWIGPTAELCAIGNWQGASIPTRQGTR
jgi:hypothetical protein